MKKGNDKLTISVNEKIKDLYKKYCEENGLKIGKQIELFMLSELKKIEKSGLKNEFKNELKGGLKNELKKKGRWKK